MDEANYLANQNPTPETVIGAAADFDRKWKEFQSKFDEVLKGFARNFAGGFAITAEEDTLSAEEKQSVLNGDVSLKHIAKKILAGDYKNIVVLTGAGISVSAGIPDFRTPGTGLYDNLQKYNLPYPTAVFDIEYFKNTPEPFYLLAKEVLLKPKDTASELSESHPSQHSSAPKEYSRVSTRSTVKTQGKPSATTARYHSPSKSRPTQSDSSRKSPSKPKPELKTKNQNNSAVKPKSLLGELGYKPTVSHLFVRLLADKGLLRRMYTQNIDMLERRAGIPSDLLIEAHGSFASAHCISESCSQREYPIQKLYEEVKDGIIPRCPACTSLVKPDIVFFGENLPERFAKEHKDDMANCDLLIVMGTSLAVAPVSSLPSQARLTVPRVLFNREAVGPFAREGISYRDVTVLGSCDESVMDFVELLRWKGDILKLLQDIS